MELEERNALVKQWQPLVWKIAQRLWKYQPIVHKIGSLDDLVSEGQLALLDAIRCYNPEHASKAGPMTYFYRSISIRMFRAACLSNMIRIPEYVRQTMLGNSERGRQFVEAASKAAYVRRLPAKFDHFDPAEDRFPEVPFWELHQALEQLTSSERELINERFGLEGQQPHTYAEMGSKRQRSKERMRQKLSIVYKKLRNLVDA